MYVIRVEFRMNVCDKKYFFFYLYNIICINIYVKFIFTVNLYCTMEIVYLDYFIK